jgi:hypothetical protein
VIWFEIARSIAGTPAERTPEHGEALHRLDADTD